MTKQEEIKQLKLEKDAVLLAHYYVPAEVQEIADYVGDSFYLSKVASKLTNKVLVFCGVSFMGESGKLLNPDKAVLMPDASADCPMAHMVTKAEIDDVRARYEDLAVVCYINSTAEIKSWSDVCVTSANAVQIVKKLPNQNILFIPDKNLGRYVAEQVPEKNVMLVKGYCPVHEEMKVKEIQERMQLLQLLHPADVCSSDHLYGHDRRGGRHSTHAQWRCRHRPCRSDRKHRGRQGGRPSVATLPLVQVPLLSLWCQPSTSHHQGGYHLRKQTRDTRTQRLAF